MSPEHSSIFSSLTLRPSEPLIPLNQYGLDLPSMRQEFATAGLNLEISAIGQQSLSETKFKDRQVGIKEVIGEEKTSQLITWCQQRSVDGPRLKKGDVVSENTQGRGLMQLAADIIQLVTAPEPDVDAFCLRLNQRVKKGLLWEYRNNSGVKQQIKAVFLHVPDAKSTLASIPPGSAEELWSFLVG